MCVCTENVKGVYSINMCILIQNVHFGKLVKYQFKPSKQQLCRSNNDHQYINMSLH
jgi:hypothetical protein